MRGFTTAAECEAAPLTAATSAPGQAGLPPAMTPHTLPPSQTSLPPPQQPGRASTAVAPMLLDDLPRLGGGWALPSLTDGTGDAASLSTCPRAALYCYGGQGSARRGRGVASPRAPPRLPRHRVLRVADS